MRSFTCDTLQQSINNGAILVDVRSQFEHENEAIPGSVNIPLNELQDRADTLDRSAEILLYCRTGARSGVAASLLQQMGFSATNIGGIVHYRGCR